MCVILSQPICGNLLQQLEEANTLITNGETSAANMGTPSIHFLFLTLYSGFLFGEFFLPIP